MPSAEKLPAGFERLASLSLRVRIRLTGRPVATKVFQLLADTAQERKAQLAQARAWAETVRRDFLGGTHVSPSQAQRTTLGQALQRYQREGLAGNASNSKVEGYRIGTILKHPIAKLPLARLRRSDVSAFRDALIERGWARSIRVAQARIEEGPDAASRRRMLDELAKLRLTRARADEDELPAIETRIAAIEGLQELRGPARTTIVNTVQLISRALKHAAETMEGVPEISGVSMPRASPGRERRFREGEEEELLAKAARVDPLMPPLIRFAVATALRRERVLQFTPGHLVGVGRGRRSILFPRFNTAPAHGRLVRSRGFGSEALPRNGARAWAAAGLTSASSPPGMVTADLRDWSVPWPRRGEHRRGRGCLGHSHAPRLYPAHAAVVGRARPRGHRVAARDKI